MNVSDLRHRFHYLVSAYILLGGVVTSDCRFLKWHAYFNCLVILHWMTNNNKCFLSEHDFEEDAGYTTHLLKKMGLDVGDNPTLATLISYAVVIGPMLWSARKLWKLCGQTLW